LETTSVGPILTSACFSSPSPLAFFLPPFFLPPFFAPAAFLAFLPAAASSSSAFLAASSSGLKGV